MPSPSATVALILNTMRDKFRGDPEKYWEHVETFDKRPILEADLDVASVTQATQRIVLAANQHFKVSGTNMTSALSTFASGGGVTLTTAGANNDQALLNPITANSAATYLSGIGGSIGSSGTSPFLSSAQMYMKAVLELSSAAAVRLVVGFKQTTTPTLATDAEQAMFSFDTASSVSATKWRRVTSVADTDSDVATDTPDVAASTRYVLEVAVDANRYPSFKVNGQFVGNGPALTTPMAFWPVIGLQALAGAAKAVTIRSLRVGRVIN